MKSRGGTWGGLGGKLELSCKLESVKSAIWVEGLVRFEKVAEVDQ